MDKEHFGSFLRRARESRGLDLTAVAEATRIPRSSLQLVEDGAVERLPAEVFVRGFIRCYAKAVAISDVEPLALFDRAVAGRRAASESPAASGLTPPPLVAAPSDDEGMTPRRGYGLAVFVIILLLIATITLSLLLRRPPQSGEGLSAVPAMNPPATLDG